jgi:rhodanese-related sulfurtransferase
VLIANEKGLKNAAAMVGGTDGWRNAGYPMEGDNVKKP